MHSCLMNPVQPLASLDALHCPMDAHCLIQQCIHHTSVFLLQLWTCMWTLVLHIVFYESGCNEIGWCQFPHWASVTSTKSMNRLQCAVNDSPFPCLTVAIFLIEWLNAQHLHWVSFVVWTVPLIILSSCGMFASFSTWVCCCFASSTFNDAWLHWCGMIANVFSRLVLCALMSLMHWCHTSL